jgi:putative membrane protein
MQVLILVDLGGIFTPACAQMSLCLVSFGVLRHVGCALTDQLDNSTPPPSRLKLFLLRWVVNTLGVLVAANVVKGISYDTTAGLFVASLLLGILNATLRPMLVALAHSCCLLVITLGLFYFVINAFLLYLIGEIVGAFHVAGFWPAFWGALVISIVSTIVGTMTGLSRFERTTPRVTVNMRARSTPPPPRKDDPGSGPMIDV